MKIAIFTDLFLENSGGIPSVIKAQKMELEKRDHEVVVFCPGFLVDKNRKQKAYDGGNLTEEFMQENVVLVPTRKWRINGVPMAKKVKEIMNFIDEKYNIAEFDLVHVHYEMGCSIAGVLLAKKYNVPIVQTMHGREDAALMLNVPVVLRKVVAGILNFLHKKYLKHDVLAKDILKMKLNFIKNKEMAKMWEIMIGQAMAADVIMTPSRHFAKKFEEIFKKAGILRQIIVAPNGINQEFWQKNAPFRKFDGGRPLNLVWNSRVSREKRIMVVLEALKIVTEKVGNDKIGMVVFGDGNQLRRAERFVQKNNLPVKFMGRRKRGEIFAKMLESDLAVMASNGFDTMGMTLIEAELQALPVVFCDEDMKEVVPEGGGILTKGVDSLAFAEVFLEILQKPEKIERMSLIMDVSREAVLMKRRILPVIQAYDLAQKMRK